MHDNLPSMIRLNFQRYEPEESLHRLSEFTEDLCCRRTVRHFSSDPVDPAVIREVLRAANSAPSGANKQPWSFVVVTDPDLKREIRKAAEEEEKKNYGGRMSQEWLGDLQQFRTDWNKEYIEKVPFLVVVFAQSYGLNESGEKAKHYYVQESVGIACGMLIAAAHRAGLATLTHTPSPMGFLGRILERPENERAYLLIPLGYPAEDAQVPDLAKKSVDDVTIWK
ncbi:MAG: nitroreductase family protein [Chlorobi bacterium]|nr:nitroreductase family protein [Chlorobiota bacterium]